MSVRDGLLSILSLGPAYGLQLHAEFTARAVHRRPVNVGQVYATLDRLTVRGLVSSAGITDDGLPLYAVTERGLSEAREWQSIPAAASGPDWAEMLDQVLITASIDTTRSLALGARYRALWQSSPVGHLPAEGTHARGDLMHLADLADVRLATAALDWLDAAETTIREHGLERPLSVDKPRRGRRPSPVA